MRYIPITNKLLVNIQNAPTLIEIDPYPVILLHGRVVSANIIYSGKTIVDVLNKLPFGVDKTTRILVMKCEEYSTDCGVGVEYYLKCYEI